MARKEDNVTWAARYEKFSQKHLAEGKDVSIQEYILPQKILSRCIWNFKKKYSICSTFYALVQWYH